MRGQVAGEQDEVDVVTKRGERNAMTARGLRLRQWMSPVAATPDRHVVNRRRCLPARCDVPRTRPRGTNRPWETGQERGRRELIDRSSARSRRLDAAGVPYHAGRRARLLGARRAADRPTTSTLGQGEDDAARARSARGGRDAAGDPARGVAAEGLGRGDAHRPDLPSRRRADRGR